MTGQVLLERNVAGQGAEQIKNKVWDRAYGSESRKKLRGLNQGEGRQFLKRTKKIEKKKRRRNRCYWSWGGITRCLPLSDALTLLFPKSPGVPTFTMPGIYMPARRYWIPSKSFISQSIPRQVSREGRRTFRWQRRQHWYQQRHWRQHLPCYHRSRSLRIRCCRCSNRRGWARKRWIP